MLTVKAGFLVCTILIILFFIFGLAMLLTAHNVVEIVERYDDKCSIGKSCDIKFDIDDDMVKPIHVYYELTNFY